MCHAKPLSKYVLDWVTKNCFPKFLDAIHLLSILVNAVLYGLKTNVQLTCLSQPTICILLQNATFLPRSKMIDHLTRLQALVSDSGLFKAGREHEREHVKALIRVRMDQLHQNSIAWQECRNLYNIIK